MVASKSTNSLTPSISASIDGRRVGRRGGFMAQKAEPTAPARSAKLSSQSAKRSPEELRSWEQVNQRLASLGEAERQIRSLRDQFEQNVAVLKQQWLEA